MDDKNTIDRAINALEDAAIEWSHYVEVDTAPSTLESHLASCFAALRAALNQPDEETQGRSLTEWAHIPQEFDDWWDSDYDDKTNPFSPGAPAYWAWAGWSAAKQQPAVPPDNGPWQVDEWTNNQIVLQSHDFTHDVALVINGDFESKDQKHQYAVALAAMLNAAPEAPAVQRASKAETALNKVLNVIQRYLPPDGPTINDAMSEIIGIVDPWPLDTQPEAPAAQKEQP